MRFLAPGGQDRPDRDRLLFIVDPAPGAPPLSLGSHLRRNGGVASVDDLIAPEHERPAAQPAIRPSAGDARLGCPSRREFVAKSSLLCSIDFHRFINRMRLENRNAMLKMVQY